MPHRLPDRSAMEREGSRREAAERPGGRPSNSRPRSNVNRWRDHALLWSSALSASIWVTLGLLLVELGIVFAVHSRRLAGVWEVQNTLFRLAPALLCAAVVVGTFGLLSVALLRVGEGRLSRWLWASQWGAIAAGLAYSASSGRHFQPEPRRTAVVLGAVLIGAAVALYLAPRIRRWSKRNRLRVPLGAVGLIVGAELVNRFVLYRLYPQWHVALALLTLWLAPWLVIRAFAATPVSWSRRERRWRVGWIGLTLVLLAVSAGSLRPFAQRLARFDNVRWLLVEQAPLLGPLVRGLAMLAPPAPLSDEACTEASCLSTERTVDRFANLRWRGRNLLLVTIDALRADHVGSYGYERGTTPNLDRLAAEGVRFEHAYAPTPHTSYSVTSLMTGKYMRPLLLQGAGADSDTWAGLLRTYGYRTAAFYPPAVFFIDPPRFEGFKRRYLDFEYRKFEFLEGDARVRQVEQYLDAEHGDRPVFAWVHLFGPHEPYEQRQGHDFGPRDIDRYDSEVAASDETVGKLVEAFRRRHPSAVVIVTADHGEEFGDHGGRYHGSSVYEEQVRVPLIVHAPPLQSAVVTQPVQTIDLLPTVLSAVEIPCPPRIRGRDLGALLGGGERAREDGFAFAETEQQEMLAQGQWRLLCQREIAACMLYDLSKDPAQLNDVATKNKEVAAQMRQRLHRLAASHGRFEQSGMRAEGKGWPDAILRAVAGDPDAVGDLIPLLDDADLHIRRKAAELCFELKREEAAPALRLALTRDEDRSVRNWAALALTRLGEGAPLTFELLRDPDRRWRRLAALALAEGGDRRGVDELIGWWMDDAARDYTRSRQLLEAFGHVRSKDAVYPLLRALHDVRLRPYIAKALEEIGDDAARGTLAKALGRERYQGARVALTRAIVSLGGEGELIRPLVRFLGVPDPLPGGVGMAREAGLLEHLGGPSSRQLSRLSKEGELGATIRIYVPKGGNGTGVRIIMRAKAWPPSDGVVRLGLPKHPLGFSVKKSSASGRKLPEIDEKKYVEIRFPADSAAHELSMAAPEWLGLRPKRSVELVIVTDRAMEVEGFAIVPLADELPPPEPEPWHVEQDDSTAEPGEGRE